MAVAYSGSCKTFPYSSSSVKGKLSDTHTKKINVEVVNGDCLLTLEGIFYLLAVCSTKCVCYWKGMCCGFCFFVLNLVRYFGIAQCLSVQLHSSVGY